MFFSSRTVDFDSCAHLVNVSTQLERLFTSAFTADVRLGPELKDSTRYDTVDTSRRANVKSGRERCERIGMDRR